MLKEVFIIILIRIEVFEIIHIQTITITKLNEREPFFEQCCPKTVLILDTIRLN